MSDKKVITIDPIDNHDFISDYRSWLDDFALRNLIYGNSAMINQRKRGKTELGVLVDIHSKYKMEVLNGRDPVEAYEELYNKLEDCNYFSMIPKFNMALMKARITSKKDAPRIRSLIGIPLIITTGYSKVTFHYDDFKFNLKKEVYQDLLVKLRERNVGGKYSANPDIYITSLLFRYDSLEMDSSSFYCVNKYIVEILEEFSNNNLVEMFSSPLESRSACYCSPFRNDFIFGSIGNFQEVISISNGGHYLLNFPASEYIIEKYMNMVYEVIAMTRKEYFFYIFTIGIPNNSEIIKGIKTHSKTIYHNYFLRGSFTGNRIFSQKMFKMYKSVNFFIMSNSQIRKTDAFIQKLRKMCVVAIY